ncbi:aminoglycoside 6-adenylyltransferase [Gracilibacillus salinarum]|uniref:Aminoglycoside 6-adenylyltransferase n=1 Tax=Gracilibacillus salinarum TaxID=2932255 RepID=A0ABY4GK04_9BACI|nr:aminoglycoside 6-adenylyltransferase [Gracilibacillus salinarum]UOQ84528.1 aminoglycoside 6-adenylyltransferase [Gracilibacillus salinarum]
MRSEKEMMELILRFAREDERVRVVGMNGSRTNPNVVKDSFQDYDIVYLVDDMTSLLKDRDWIDYFGERMIMQTPEESTLFPSTLGGWFTFLIQFTDGNRLDLMLIPIEEINNYIANDTLTRILLDKDELIEDNPLPNESSHYIKQPTYSEFVDCCNEFWWVNPYVAKGLCRDQYLYATHHIDKVLREELLRVMAWNIGVTYDFKVNLGAAYKLLPDYLEPERFQSLQATYQLHTTSHCWESLFLMQQMFSEEARLLADRLDYTYPDHFERVINYIRELYRAE